MGVEHRPFGPDGDPSLKTNILALGPISGLVAPGWLFLAGVFLGNGAPRPGYYSDNEGSATATVTIGRAPP